MSRQAYSVRLHDDGWAVGPIGKTLGVFCERRAAELEAERLANLGQADGQDAEGAPTEDRPRYRN